MFNFVSPHPGHALFDKAGNKLAEFAPNTQRRPTKGLFSTTDLHLAVRVDEVAAQHGIRRGVMTEADVRALEQAKAAAADGSLELAPVKKPAPQAPAPVPQAVAEEVQAPEAPAEAVPAEPDKPQASEAVRKRNK